LNLKQCDGVTIVQLYMFPVTLAINHINSDKMNTQSIIQLSSTDLVIYSYHAGEQTKQINITQLKADLTQKIEKQFKHCYGCNFGSNLLHSANMIFLADVCNFNCFVMDKRHRYCTLWAWYRCRTRTIYDEFLSQIKSND
jgi:hypothetical protein